MNRTLPHNLDVEKSLLGCLITYPDSYNTMMEENVVDDDFYLNSHRIIFKAIVELNESNKPFDLVSLHAKLSDDKLLEKAGNVSYLAELSSTAITSANALHYTKILQSKAFARRIIETASEIADDGFEGKYEVDDYIDIAEKRILQVTRSRKTTDFLSSNFVAEEYFKKVLLMNENKSAVTGVKTGFAALDRKTNGLQRGDLIIVAARPSVGKTAFALNLAARTAKNNKNEAVAIFSLEMPAEQLMGRILAADSKLPIYNLRTGILNNREIAQLKATVNNVKDYKLYIDDASTVKTSEIFSKCRRLKAEQGLSLIVIDYIQLITGNGYNRENRQQEVSEISRNLKALARELEVPVIALSQLSRGVETRNDKRPMLSDLRESGAIEQDADIVILLSREGYQTKEEADDQTVEVIMAKHRNGATGTIEMMFTKSINAFKDIEIIRENKEETEE